MEKSLDLLPSLVVFLAAAHVIALFAASIVDRFGNCAICRFTGFIDWHLIVSLREKKCNKETWGDSIGLRFIDWWSRLTGKLFGVTVIFSESNSQFKNVRETCQKL
ncbi:unnamed protein product [Arabis nemorensis]|uniref:Uncharacterized protein n=1 Tax=Arabis nemorensis TaxID=586526 RepID=A0A565CUK3_9BRAS|nr:unnamed protein product [Arabis nemorensis]